MQRKGADGRDGKVQRRERCVRRQDVSVGGRCEPPPPKFSRVEFETRTQGVCGDENGCECGKEGGANVGPYM